MNQMNQVEFSESIQDVFKRASLLLQKKNSDYSGQDDPFKNFRLCEAMGLVSVERGLLVRMLDKMGRISTLIKNNSPQVQESIEDTLIDLINYSAILVTYLKTKE